MNSGRQKAAFTLIEMLVVISIIGILASMTLPAISTAREAARGTQCAAYLKDFGVALIGRSISHPDDAFCSGNFDLIRDGVPTEIGWVADVVTRDSIPSEMLCPSNGAFTSSAIEQVLTLDVANFVDDPCVDRLGREKYVNSQGVEVKNICRTIKDGSIAPRSEARRTLIQEKMIENGYNTNYAATWFLTRSELLLDQDGNPKPTGGCTDTNPKNRGVTRGPLTSAMVTSGKAPASTVPLLCDGAPAGFLSEPIGELVGVMYARAMVGSPIGSRLLLDTDNDGVGETSSGFHLSTPVFPPNHPRTGLTGWYRTWSAETRQDYKGLGVFHGGVANILMADGHVAALYDSNQDGFINNGFDATAYNGQQLWTSGDLEADQLQLASYYSLHSKGGKE